MASTADLMIKIGADLKNYEKNMGKMKQSLQKVGDGIVSIGKTAAKATIAIGAAFATASVAIGKKGLESFAAYEKGMNEVFTLLPGISGEAMDKMSAQVLDFSKKFGVLPEKTIPALYQAISASVPQDNVFSFLETAIMAARGGVTELETAVDGISSVINAYGTDVLKATEASDLMFTAVKLGKTTFEELAASLFNVVPTASSLSVGFDEITAAMSAMTAQGVPTSVATTQMRQLLVELSKPGNKTAQLFEKIAKKSFVDFVKSGGTVADALDLMQKHAEKNNISISGLFGSVEAGNAALALSGKNAVTYRKHLAEMDKSAGATETAFETMDKGITAAMDRMKATIEATWIGIGDRIAPAAEEAMTGLMAIMSGEEGGAAKFASGANKLVKSFMSGMTKALPDVIKSGLSILNGIIRGITDNSGQINTAIVTLVTGLSAAIQQNLVPVVQAGMDLMMSLVNTLLDEAPALIDVGLKAINTIAQSITDNIGPISTKAVEVIAHFATALTEQGTIEKLITAVFTVVAAFATAILKPESLAAITNAAVNLITSLVAAIVDPFNTKQMLLASAQIINVLGEGFGDKTIMGGAVVKLFGNLKAVLMEMDWIALGKEIANIVVISIAKELVTPLIRGQELEAARQTRTPFVAPGQLPVFTNPISKYESPDYYNNPYGNMASYDTGTSFVPFTGPALLHRGERVLTADENRRYNKGSVNVTVNGASSPEQVAGIVVQRMRMAGTI